MGETEAGPWGAAQSPRPHLPSPAPTSPSAQQPQCPPRGARPCPQVSSPGVWLLPGSPRPRPPGTKPPPRPSPQPCRGFCPAGGSRGMLGQCPLPTETSLRPQPTELWGSLGPAGGGTAPPPGLGVRSPGCGRGSRPDLLFQSAPCPFPLERRPEVPVRPHLLKTLLIALPSSHCRRSPTRARSRA